MNQCPNANFLGAKPGWAHFLYPDLLLFYSFCAELNKQLLRPRNNHGGAKKRTHSFQTEECGQPL